MKRIVVIGAGNVASHIISSLLEDKCSYEFVGCYGRSKKPSELIEKLCGEVYFSDFSKMPKANIYIVAVSDDAIAEVTKYMFPHISKAAIVLHTSGTKSIDVINNNIEHRGVLYPLQTFSCNVPLNMKEIPFFIECKYNEDWDIIDLLACEIGKSATIADSDRRKIIHIAAVFTCNFTNHMFSISQNILKNDNLEFTIMEPLINECLRKALSSDDISSLQTGPAKRCDVSTINSHLDMLDNYIPEVKNIYRDITNSIINNGKF